MSDLDLIPAGHVFTADEITVFAGQGERTLEQAIADADVLVSCPHAGARIPEELVPFLSPALTKRLQYDFTDVATDAIVRAWARSDPRIVAVLNPHPRLVRDPNRARPADIAADLSTAIERTRQAGPWQPVDLTGVDAIRPVTFSFFPILEVPDDEAERDRLVQTFVDVGERGLGVYERTRDELTERFVAAKLRTGGRFTRLSFHDTMNTTTTREGAVDVARAPQDRLPAVVALSNRGGPRGEERDPADPPTMAPERLRALAEAHRAGFRVDSPDAVALNTPYLGSQEILAAGRRFRELADDATEAALELDAVQAEFLREFLLGPEAVAELHRPGTDWIREDPAHVEQVAASCRRSWDLYRDF
ncbi:N-formylglutamate amidohydrolase [Streptomyces sp. AC495_CC817]|uniref:N-formylglutamate amidohydrolase n=1 Tax=Streptomyces sp. AC495_CC817 TaxID=2823900 RepID=UPI001C27856E|nr:N-formylglutamate amidohydrolase [Streptomyces sp. AC495_CC817]